MGLGVVVVSVVASCIEMEDVVPLESEELTLNTGKKGDEGHTVEAGCCMLK